MMRGTLVLSENSWHVKLYRFWQRYGKIKNGTVSVPNENWASDTSNQEPYYITQPKYKENLCHYWRCVMIWAMFRWFFSYKIKNTFITPFSIVGAIGIGITVFTLVVIFPMQSLLVVGCVIAGAIVLAGMMILAAVIDDHQMEIGNWIKKYVWSWLKYPFRAIGKICAFLAYKVWDFALWVWKMLNKVNPKVWFSLILCIMVLSIVFGLVAIWLINPRIYLWMGVAILIGLGAGLTFIVVGHFIPEREEKPKVDKGPGMVKVTGQYMVAMKHNICPFIEFKD